MKQLFFVILVSFSASVMATQPTGKIAAVTFYGVGDSEMIFVTMDPPLSACAYGGSYVMPVKGRSGIVAAFLAAFQAQNTVTLFGTGACDSVWANSEVINYASFKR